jgi:nucleoside-triphosphatase THEP1
LPEVWLKAAVLGSLWASIEIVAGAFLHNLRLPLAGAALAAAGSALLIGAHQIWPEQGLFWRAGIICALMKSVSPSAVILGPMVGILSESLLLEAATMLLGRTFPAYLLGGALAVSWTFFQRIANALIQFGPSIVTLYVNIFEFAARNLGARRLGPIGLLAMILAVHIAIGVAAAIFAVTVGRKVQGRIAIVSAETCHFDDTWQGFRVETGTGFSLSLLAVNLAGLAAGLWLLNRSSLWIAGGYVATYSVWIAWRYRRSLQRLARARLWLELAALTIVSGFLLGNLQAGAIRWTWAGMLTGVAMTVRAWLMTAAFAAIGVELRNPRIVDWFARQRLRTLSEALAVAFQALPFFVASLSSEQRLIRQPMVALSTLLLRAEAWLQNYRAGEKQPARVMLLTGDSGEGKSTLVGEAVTYLRQEGVIVGGVLAPGYWKDEQRLGFDVVDLMDGRKAPLCHKVPKEADGDEGTSFGFFPDGLRLGREALSTARLREGDADLVIVDEVGPLELSGDGWSSALDSLTDEWSGPMLWVVRRELVQDVTNRWLRTAPVVRDVRNIQVADLVRWLGANGRQLPSRSATRVA